MQRLETKLNWTKVVWNKVLVSKKSILSRNTDDTDWYATLVFFFRIIKAATNSYFHSGLICWLIYKMSENDKTNQCFPKPKMTSSNILFCQQPKNNQFTVTEEERNQKIFTFKKLETDLLHKKLLHINGLSVSFIDGGNNLN